MRPGVALASLECAHVILLNAFRKSAATSALQKVRAMDKLVKKQENSFI